MTDNEPMSDEQLAQIRQRINPNYDRSMLNTYAIEARNDRIALFAEVERLRVENAAMRAIVEAVAHGATTYRDREDEYCTQDPNCMWLLDSPGKGMVHTDRCIVTKARALIEKEDNGE